MARSVQYRCAIGCSQCAESRYVQKLEYDGDQRAVWSAVQSKCDARYSNNSEIEVLTMMRLRNKTLLAILPLGFLTLTTAHAQQQPQSAQQQSQQQQTPFTIKVDTQLVVETVIVKDKDSKPIEGLTEKDFSVTEDNVPQTISVFRFQKLEDTPVAAMPQQPTITPPVVNVEPAKPAQIAAPRLDAQYQDRRLLVLFFDMMNTPPADQLRAFTAAD